ncbi:heterokaryon incompatibility protein-domain-containing protein [Truncatella angustata]|uniref:Heterokaryon incompatibility protein-domain-containing protein n=1 Tax=Truncatella angustata TaxID=152316 RepID=A0A9P8UV70_9PEZI|nr:heterokaryon incompatibility protein-domain-containing protein [Truncatella angustata]KAH6658947.1 heterokaryon incompatibility protein-domain-containing protein [Truncatella angustata]
MFYRYLVRLLHASTIKPGSPVIARFDPKRNGYLRLPRSDLLRVYSAGEGDISSQQFPVAKPYPDVRSERAFDQAKCWIQECYATHRFCTTIQTGFAPTRLMEIGEKGASHVRIVETRTMTNVRWASLSYVWGGPQEIRTTIATLPANQKGIEVATLPKTLVDAIEVCRELTLSYLWIDALCIIQDDPGDLLHELGCMPSIYQESYVTISAAKAVGVQEGFLNETAVYTYDSLPPTQISYESRHGKLGHVLLCQFDHHRVLLSDPIDSRAWTYQETLLSPRLLRYSRNYIQWSCRSCQLYDGSWKKQDMRFDSDAYNWNYGEVPCVPGLPMPAWEPVVEAYSNRNMTNQSDKLVAISAIAQVFAKAFNYIYLAGLWRETLPLGLCWMVAQGIRKPRPKELRAPSWSWTSIDNPIRYAGDWFRKLDETRDGATGGFIGMTTVADGAEVLDYTLVPTKPGLEYISIKSAELTLRGAIRPVEWNIDYSSGIGSIYAPGIDVDETLFTGYADAWEDDWPQKEAVLEYLETHAQEGVSGNEDDDDDDDDEQSDSGSSAIVYKTLEVFALLAIKSRSYDHGYLPQGPGDNVLGSEASLERCGLLLTKDGDKYKRVGFLRWYVDEELYNSEAAKLPGFEMRTITII